ncbi:hypothetical protein WJX84_001196, partial [Apatococcus fuscideae]
EPESNAEQQQKALQEDDIDNILARAEVVQDTKAEGGGAGDDLLASFNVATFQGEADDAAFWERLIPVNERTAAEVAEEKELGVRSARLKNADDQISTRDSSPDSAGGRSSRKSGKASRREGTSSARKFAGGKDAPGAPIEGAALRVDEWPSPRGNGSQNGAACKPLSKRDAGLFVRAVRHYGMLSQMDLIAAEVGPRLVEASPAARKALWKALVEGCEQVQMESDAAGAREVVLDFFGVSVKAQDVTSFINRMQLLASKIEAVKEPEKHFRLETLLLPPAKWASACGWTTRDDAALLLGVYWHGLGHWDKIGADERLALDAKLAAASAEKTDGKKGLESVPAQKDLPKGTHLETRVLALLRKLESAATLPSVTLGRGGKAGTNARGVAAGYGKQSTLGFQRTGAQPPSKRRRTAAAEPEPVASHAPAPSADEVLMTEVMMEVKKLRTLQRKGSELERTKVVDKTRKYLRQVGDHIERIAERKGTKAAAERRRLWNFVSTFTENNMSGAKLMSIYQRLASGEHTSAADHNILASGRAGSGADMMGDAGEDGELVGVRRGHLDGAARHAPAAARPRSGQHDGGWGSHGERSQWKGRAESVDHGWDAPVPEGSGLKEEDQEEEEDDGEYEPGESREPSWPGHDRSEDHHDFQSRDWEPGRGSRRGGFSTASRLATLADQQSESADGFDKPCPDGIHRDALAYNQNSTRKLRQDPRRVSKLISARCGHRQGSSCQVEGAGKRWAFSHKEAMHSSLALTLLTVPHSHKPAQCFCRSAHGSLSSSTRSSRKQLSVQPLRQSTCSQRSAQRLCASVKDWNPPTISDTKQKFYKQFKTPINPIYNTVIQELLVQQHLMRWNINYKYDAIFGLGFTSVFDQVLGGLPAETSKKLFMAYLNALDENADQYRQDTEQMTKWAAEKKGSPDQVTPKEDGDDFQKALAAVAEKGKMGSWHYTRFFAIGLFRLLELTEAKDPKALNSLVKAMNASPDAVNRDLMTYKGVLSKLNAAKEMMKEMVEREQRKNKEREAEKAEKAKAASNASSSSESDSKPEAKPADVKA